MQKRNVLWWLLMLLMICNTMVTININIAIVSMVKSTDDEDSSLKSAHFCPNSTFFLRNTYLDATADIRSKQSGFNWSKAEQTMVLSGHYWLNYISILPGGVLTHKFGTKLIVGFAQFISSILSSLIPIFAVHGPITVAWIRAMQGILSSICVPVGMFTILGNWSPPQERGKFGSLFSAGCGFGLFFGNFIFGYIAEHIHWKFVFHLTSVSGLIWIILWYYLIYDSPRQHPNISEVERNYIENSLSDSMEVNSKKLIPWKAILTSVPFIVCLLAENSLIWQLVVSLTYIPIYYKTMYGLNANEIGIIRSFPQLIVVPMSLCYGNVVDICLKKKLISITNSRKLGGLLGSIVAVLPLILIALVGCDINLAIWGILASFIIGGCATVGPILALVDMSPKFCGILEGFAGTTTALITFVLSALISYLAKIWDIDAVWNFTFLFTAFYVILTNTLFLIFGSAEVQPWNLENTEKEKTDKNNPEHELMLSTLELSK